MKKNIIIVISAIVAIGIVIYLYLMFVTSGYSAVSINVPAKEVLAVVPLSSQKDFKLIGNTLFIGSGFEPGFNFKMNLAGQKFGIDLVSQYGDTHYVGYLDLVAQSSSTKIFAGNLLDKSDKSVACKFILTNKKCGTPKGDYTPFTVNINVGTEELLGCANLYMPIDFTKEI